MAPSLVSLPLPVLLILCAMLHPAAASGGDLLMLGRFHRWMSVHGRSYPNTDEKLRRFEVYRRNVEFIDATNRDSERLGYELGENDFTDLTDEEFAARYTGGALVPKEQAGVNADGIITTLAGDVHEGRQTDLNASLSAPEKWDWRDHGAVTPARDQSGCGSCWAFAAVATVESLNKINGGELLDLSEQELIDCDVAGQKGCEGGLIKEALQWIQTKGGLQTEYRYPYRGWQLSCRSFDRAPRVGKLTGVREVRGEQNLKLAVSLRPVGVYIDAQGATMKSYKSGIYKGPCTTYQNHVVVLIGYGVSNNGDKYWILKNSWGREWGQDGFFFMRREADGELGLCGLAEWGTYPLM